MKRFAIEFLIASLACCIFLLWAFREPILSRRPAFFSTLPPASEAAEYTHEFFYQNLWLHYTKAKFIRQGVFPTWSPDSHGGTPFIGEMQSGVFSPFNLLFYVFPLPVASMLSVALKFYAAFCFVYLFSRILGTGLLGSIFAGMFFITIQYFHNFAHYSLTGSVLSLPLLLLLAELYFRGSRRLSLFFLPWAAALSFFCGHFEIAFRSNLATGIYFICRLWMEDSFTNKEKLKHLLTFSSMLALGLIIAGFQIYAGWDYVYYSYSKVWRMLEEYGRSYNAICKHLTMEDIPLLTAGVLCLSLFWISLKRCASVENIWTLKELARKIVSCALLATAIACLANVGLDTSLMGLFVYKDDPSMWIRLVNLFILFLAFWSWRHGGSSAAHTPGRDNAHPAFKILGYFALINILINLKTSPFTNILIHIPPYNSFTIMGYNYEFHLAVGILSASTMQKWGAVSSKPLKDRWKTTLGALSILCIFLFGYIGSRPLTGFVARHIPSGLNVIERGQPDGGIMGPHRRRTFGRNTIITGWVPVSEPVAGVSVNAVENNQVIKTVNAKIDVGRSASRLYFYADIPFPPKVSQVRIFAQVRYANGTKRLLRGPRVRLLSRGRSKKPWNRNLLMLVVLAFPFIFLWKRVFMRPVFVLLLVFCASRVTYPAVRADRGPLQLPEMVRLKQDKTFFRISSLSPGFGLLRANYANLYDIADIRNGGDGLDVLTMVHFLNLSNRFLSSQDTALRKIGFRLLGLANVKYFIDTASASPDHPELKLHHRGPYISIFKNIYAMPRAIFFHDYVHIPLYLRDRRDWRSQGKILAPLINWLAKDSPTLKNLLPLHDLPSASGEGLPVPDKSADAGLPSASGETPATARVQGSGPSTVKITEYLPDRVVIDVNASRPGFVFLSDNYFAGWKAFVNGKKTKILRSWITFRSVHVPAGKSKVVFLYRPFWLLTALPLSVCMAVLWLILYLERSRLPAGPGKIPVKQVKPAKSQKAQNLAMLEAAKAEGLAHLCAKVLEPVLLVPIAAVFIFWIFWSGFVYKGLAVNAAAWLAGAGIVFAVIRSYHSYRRASTGSSFEA